MKVQGKVCVVTGAAGGIGEAVARRYAAEGAKGVVVADRPGDNLQRVAKEIGGLAVPCDVAVEGDIKKLVSEAERAYGPVDVFFSNAGIARAGHEGASDKDWADSWAIHVMSHVYAARALVPGMLARQSGYLLNTASAAGLLASMARHLRRHQARRRGAGRASVDPVRRQGHPRVVPVPAGGRHGDVSRHRYHGRRHRRHHEAG